MGKGNGGGVPAGMHSTLLIGQKFLEVDIAAQYRKIPVGVPLPLAGLFSGDKEQLDRIEACLNRLLDMLELSVQMVQGDALAREQLPQILPPKLET